MIADVFATVLFDGTHPRDPALVNLLGLSPRAASGAEVNVKTALGLSPLWRAINLIGDATAKCRPIIYKRLPGPGGRDKERAMDHPARRFVSRWANEWMSAGEFRKLLTIWAILHGNGIAHVERDGSGTIIDAVPLLPDRTGMAVFNQPITQDSSYPGGGNILYWTRVGGETRTILPENILHIRNTSWNGIWGIDLVTTMRETLGLAIAARDSGARFFGQGMLPSGVLYMPPGINKGPKGEEAEANFIAAIKEQAMGLGKSHRLLVVGEGAKYETMSIEPEKAQALETREFSALEISNMTGAQPHKIGHTKRTSYASLEQSNQEQLDDGYDPWLGRWEETLERTCLTDEEQESESHFVECNRKALLRTNLQARTSYYTAGRNGGWLSANDILRMEGDDPIGPQGDVYLVPANMTTADQAGAAFVNNGEQGAGSREPDDDDEDEDEEQETTRDDEAARLAGDYRALALHECGRMISRTLAEACRKATKGGVEFCAFLEAMEDDAQQPAALAPVLRQLARQLSRELNRYTLPPYAAADLKANVTLAGNQLKDAALATAAELIDQFIPTRSKAA
jgi:HK97 family phage portal protein